MADYNGFRVTIPECFSESSDRHVSIGHGKQFSVRLYNNHKGPNGCVPCDAEVFLNGNCVGNFRVPYGQYVIIEHPTNDSGRFTAYKEDSSEAREIGIDRSSQDLGLIEVIFRPGTKKIRPIVNNINIHWSYPTGTIDNSWKPCVGDGPNWNYTPTDYTYSTGNLRRKVEIYENAVNRSLTSSSCSTYSDPEPCGMGIGLSGASNQPFYDTEELDYNEPETRIILRLVSETKVDRPRAIRPVVYTTGIPRKM